MVIFAFPGYDSLASQLETAGHRGEFNVGRFENGEIFVRVLTEVRHDHCVLLGSLTPPHERLLSFLLLAHTLKKEGCHKISALLPYLAYTRQDKDKRGESLAASWIGALLSASGIDEVLTVDLHSQRDQQLFPIPLISSFPTELFASAIRRFGLTDATVVAPDNGAIPRCKDVNEALLRPAAAIPYFEKLRHESGIKHTRLFGVVGRRALIIDDMLDTGGTLISACRQLVEAGTREIFIVVTHGLFTGTDWKRLWSLNVQRIFCTDTIPALPAIREEQRITILPIRELLREQLSGLQLIAAKQ